MTMTEQEHVAAPGSRVHSAQKQADYMPSENEVTQDYVEEQKFIVPVKPEVGSHTTFRSVYIAANTTRNILGRNDLRKRATIACTSGTAILCQNGQMANAVQNLAIGSSAPTSDVPGFYMPSAISGLYVPVEAIATVVAVATTNAAAVLSIAEEWFDVG